MSSDSLKGKVAIVTGGGTLFGAAVAKTLINDGAKVMIVEINAESGAAAAKACGATFFHGDVTDDSSISKMVDSVISSWGRVDVLVNLACSYDDSGADSTRAQWTNTLNVNIASAAMLATAVRPYMAKQGGGSIINISSVQAMASQQTVAPYAASKGGVISFTRSIALDYAADGIRANAVLPGSVETPMLRAAGEQCNPSDPEGAMKNWGALHPLGFLIQPRDIANVIAFLASDEARVITGAPIIADSGLLAGLGV